jgi:hypothetical protein
MPPATEAEPLLGTAAGAPLRAMASLAAIWILVRVIMLQSPANMTVKPVDPLIGNTAHHYGATKRPGLAALPVIVPKQSRYGGASKQKYLSVYAAERRADASPIAEPPAAIPPGLSGRPWQDSDDVRGFFLQASFNRPGGVANDGVRPDPLFPKPPALYHGNRLTAYFWIYGRQDSRAPQAGQRQAGRSISNGQYGGSQAGAILSYRLLDRPAPDISVYGRLSTALAPWSQQEIALGTRMHPVRNLPVALHAEQRFDASSGGFAGTAFYATGGTGPDPIVEKFALETYAQTGYVLGQNETYFYDGSVTLQRPIAELGSTKFSVGPGAWAGGQRKISRVDVGPRVDLSVPLGTTSARIVADWRLRIAGNARPGNGAAITVSTAF